MPCHSLSPLIRALLHQESERVLHDDLGEVGGRLAVLVIAAAGWVRVPARTVLGLLDDAELERLVGAENGLG